MPTVNLCLHSRAKKTEISLYNETPPFSLEILLLKLVKFALPLLLLSIKVQAADVNAGLSLYQLNCSNSSCHGPDPSKNVNGVRKAIGNPGAISSNIASDTGGMGTLRGLFNATDLDNIAAYIANPTSAVASPISLSSTSTNFGNVPIGSLSAGITITLNNIGKTALSNVKLALGTADFVLFSGCPTSLAVGKNCFFNLHAAPRTLAALTDKLTVTYTGQTVPASVALSVQALSANNATVANQVIEYYNPDVDHFFITAGTDEQKVVDSGAAGRWLRTGFNFKSGGDVSVCRFYGNTNFDPATGKIYGPNSHFYTGNTAECNELKAGYLPNALSWKFESLDFLTRLPVGGSCPNGTIPVYRAYNNGFNQKIASNHRLTTDKAAYDKMLLVGWVAEGISLCGVL
jgi:Repeat of unknown function (DUF5648)